MLVDNRNIVIRVLLGLCLGVAVGAVLGPEYATFVDSWIAPFGKAFINDVEP